MTPINLDLKVAKTETQQDVMTLTDSAAVKVGELIKAESNDDLVLRVAVQPGGCSGFSYEMFFDTDVAQDDHVSEVNGVRLVVDPASAPHLIGAKLDYKDGLMDSGFTIDNPSASRTCGCGNSFS